MKFTGKGKEAEHVILSEVAQAQEDEHHMVSRLWFLAPNLQVWIYNLE